MSLINSSYFIGERNVPNSTYPDVLSTLNNLIDVHEKKYLQRALGYELFKNFMAGLLEVTIEPRFLDILFGKEFTGVDGRLKKWMGLISVTEETPSIEISTSSVGIDLFFTVGIGSAPADGDDTYVNSSLANKQYKVIQRVYGPLEALKDDNSNVVTADIQINSSGGFTWLNGIKFSDADKYLIELQTATLDVTDVEIVPEPDSPIADYVYYYWLKNMHTQTAGIGQVKTDAQNAHVVSPKYKACDTWNNMAEKTSFLYELLRVNIADYPEYELYLNDSDLISLLTKIHPFF